MARINENGRRFGRKSKFKEEAIELEACDGVHDREVRWKIKGIKTQSYQLWQSFLCSCSPGFSPLPLRHRHRRATSNVNANRTADYCEGWLAVADLTKVSFHKTQ